MTKHWLMLALLAALAACGDGDSNPVNGNPPLDGGDGDDGGDGGDDGDGGGDGGDGGPIEGGGQLPPGTPSPTPDDSIFRREARTGDGNGFAEQIAYDAATDTFAVDNLGFDGDNIFTRDDTVGTLPQTQFAVYESADFLPDGATGTPVAQLEHKALYGVSPSGNLAFAIVRTGAFIEYGFGGFVYQRDGGVVLPESGQATYSGRYGGLRDFLGIANLEYATGDMTLDIDFEDFNDGPAVKARIDNRQIFDRNGNNITDNVIAAIEADAGVQVDGLPVMRFVIEPGVLDENGEIAGSAFSTVPTAGGGAEAYEEGSYFAVIGGDNADEIVGVVVVEAEDPRFDAVTVRETGGFALVR